MTTTFKSNIENFLEQLNGAKIGTMFIRFSKRNGKLKLKLIRISIMLKNGNISNVSKLLSNIIQCGASGNGLAISTVVPNLKMSKTSWG